ncbi:MAG: membrane protein insertion efficiency factor YidD [Gemmatimonadota bacterium]
MKAALLGVIGLYRSVISPLLPPACRFEPSCSEYARIAVDRFGPARGSWLALRRLGRCQPFGGSGWDPVPEADNQTADTDEGDR